MDTRFRRGMGAEKTQEPRGCKRLDDEHVRCGWVGVERQGARGGFDFSKRAHKTLRAAGNRRSPRVRVDAELGRRGLAIEIASDGARPDAGSWRFLLAMNLAAKLDATLVSQPEVAAYLIQFR